MEKLNMHTPDMAEENYKKLAALFPDAVTETIDDEGKVVRAIDKDVLMQEINAQVVDDGQERYQFTWPDKRKSVVLANAPIAKTLRFEQEKSVGRDGTPGGTDSENIYIEGDNLDALKLLQETYLGKVKMIYIDPPYNTGNDFLYEDDFSQSAADYANNSGQTDDEGNRLVQNSESNGRFHTDWLNMLYPRLRIAKDLLSDEGAIFISIDDNEQANLRKMCDEIFGASNFIAQINWKGRGGRQDSKYYAVIHEYILVYSKNADNFVAGEEIKSGDVFPYYDKDKKRNYKTQLLRKWGSTSRLEDRPNLYYPIPAPDGTDLYPMLNANECGRWRWGKETMQEALHDGRVEFVKKENEWVAYEKIFAPLEGEEKTQKYVTWIDDISNGTSNIKTLFGKTVFDYAKSPELITKFIKMANVDESQTVLDFFSGSATTAHAVIQLNAEDGGHRKFILVQLPEETDKKSEAHKAGYKTICDIGEERIRRAGKKIKEETGADIDYGFRCFKVDSSNMKDVYYRPADIGQMSLDLFTNNIKEDRTPDDLLIQVMLDLGVLLSSRIEQIEIAGKKVFSVDDGYMMACFDNNVTDDVVTSIAKQHPFYAVFRDSSMANDSVAANFEQIFATYSPQTVRKVL